MLEAKQTLLLHIKGEWIHRDEEDDVGEVIP